MENANKWCLWSALWDAARFGDPVLRKIVSVPKHCLHIEDSAVLITSENDSEIRRQGYDH